jgi:uncharacterized DUF497 family protein
MEGGQPVKYRSRKEGISYGHFRHRKTTLADASIAGCNAVPVDPSNLCPYNNPERYSLRFAFDPDKDAINLAKHGLSLADAGNVFAAPGKLTLQSNRAGEARLMDLAFVEAARTVLVLIYALRNPGEVRAVSLRCASKHERKLHADWQEAR